MKKLTLSVKGMYCSHCSKAVENALNKAGVMSNVNLSNNTVTFTYDDTKISLDYLKRLVKRAGYELVIDEKKHFDFNIVLLPISVILLVLCLLGMIHHLGVHNSFFFFLGNNITFLVEASIALVVLGTPFIIRAIKGIRYKNIGMDFLIAFSSLVSYALSLYIFIKNIQNGIALTDSHVMSNPDYQMGYFDATIMILSIITFGHKIIDSIKLKADKNYKKAVLEPPKFARLNDDPDNKIDVDEIEVDDEILVLAGEQIPVDGVVISGKGSVDESSLNGESRPRIVLKDSKVMGSTLLLKGPVVMRASKIALDSLYSSIINESYALDHQKGKLSRLSDIIASIFTPAIVLLAIISFFICAYGMGLSYEEAIVRAVSVLSVSCPCAFGLAVPIASLSGYDLALKNGVLFKTGDTFEKIKSIKAVVFDKTGTLSLGKLKVEAKICPDEYGSIIKSMEQKSLHPLAIALVEDLSSYESLNDIEVEEIPGVGLKYKEFLLGSEKTIQNKEISDEFKEFVKKYSNSSLIFFSDNRKVLSVFSLEDELVSDAKKTISKLQDDEIKCYMLTGDRKDYAYKIANEINIPASQVYYEADPSKKADILREIRKENGVICYVGDGINDTLALKESDLSFASYKASEVACSSADALLMKPELYVLYYALKISKKTYINIIENFIWAILYNITMIPLAILGIIEPALCAALMIVSNLTLTINSLRLRLYKPMKEEKNHDHDQS